MHGKRIIPIFVIIMFWLIFFWRQIVGGEVWYCCDNLLINIPSKVFLVAELKQGRLPISNPYIFSGSLFFADINLSLLHPNTLFYFLFSPFRALTLGILFSYLTGSLGMYALGRTFRFERFSSLVGAIVFGLSGSLVVYANNISILQVASLVPWVIAMWIRYLKTMTGRDLVMFVCVASLQVFSGHPQLTYYTWLVLLGYTLLEKPSSQRAKQGLKAAILIALVTSVQTVPFIRFMLESTRTGQDFAAASSGSVHPLSLIRLLIPGLVGDLSRGTAWIQAGSMHGYVGLLPILILPIAWMSKQGKFFFGVAIISLLLAMGKYTPVYWIAYHLTPGIALFREPAQFLFLWTFGVAGAAMVGMETLMKKPWLGRYIVLIGHGLLLAAGFIHAGESRDWNGIQQFSVLPSRLIAKVMNLPLAVRTMIIDRILYNITFGGAMIVVVGLVTRIVRVSMIAKIIVLVILFADLFVYGQTNVTTIAEATVNGWQEAGRTRIASWNVFDTNNSRYYTDPTLYPYPYKKLFGQYNDPGESEWQFKILRPNLGILYGLPAVDGYASMVLRSYQAKFSSSGFQPTGVIISSIVDPELPKAGVRYILSKPNNLLLSDTTRYTVVANEGDMAVYEDKAAIPITIVKGIE
ncbi:MAG: YfhO family protein [Candidatus Gottesmanbacteria bacterium]|nr:YfhO family protein [Candidatus Gottesmanbacteria bacterium]